MDKSELPSPELCAKDFEEIKGIRDKMEELNKRYPFYGYMELNLSIQCSLVSYQEKIDKLSRRKVNIGDYHNMNNNGLCDSGKKGY